MIGPFGRQGLAATLRQYCPQMTQRRCILPQWVSFEWEPSRLGLSHNLVRLSAPKSAPNFSSFLFQGPRGEIGAVKRDGEGPFRMQLCMHDEATISIQMT